MNLHKLFQYLLVYSMNEQQSSLTPAKVQNILKLEELFHNKFLTVQLLHELVSLYTCCIECIDENQQNIRSYFLQKIQFVLSRPQMQAMLNAVNNIQQKGMVSNLRQTLRATQRNQMSQHVEFQALKPNFDKKKLYGYDGDNPDEKKKKIDLQINLMNQMEKDMKNITSQVNAADLKLKNQKMKINDIAKEQNNRLQQRLARRKNKKRKRSADEKQDESPVKIQKFDLIKVQQQIKQAVDRITVRVTERQNRHKETAKNEGKMAEKDGGKGRIKTLVRKDTENDD